MIRYRKKFDAKAYWAGKPLCTICQMHKVKDGVICSECRKPKRKNDTPLVTETSETKQIIEMGTEHTKQLKNEEAASTETFGVSVSPEAQNKIIRLFTYLEKALSLDDTIVRDFRATLTSPSPWWLADYPSELDNLYIRPLETEEQVSDPEQSNVYLRVQKRSIESAPELPEKLSEWVTEITPLSKPIVLQKIDRKVHFDNDKTRVSDFKKFRKDFKQGDALPESLVDWVVLSPDKLPEAIEVKYSADSWDDHPELKKILVGYIENEWKDWADKVVKIYKANLLYDQLYALRLLLKNEGDNYELLLGQGILTWNHRAVGAIYSPIFLTPLILDFDATKRTIEISPDPIFRNFVEITSVSETDNPAEIDLDKWMGAVNSNPFDFWHYETLKSQANTFLNYLSPDGEDCFKEEIAGSPTITENPAIWNTPVIFARKRTNSLWSKYAETIRRDIEKNGSLSTEFINDLVGEYGEEKNGSVDFEEKTRETFINDSELFFPLPWNDEQKRIAERLDSNYGVVVKGPPGTGKSHTIANLIARFLAEGKSVLVTSQTSKALEVLRDKLPENIRSLAVSQLHQTAKRDDMLQQSIAEISSNLGERHTKFSESKAEVIRKELKSVREEKASISNQIREYILTDSTQLLKANGGEVTPIEAAKFICEQNENPAFSWFMDEVHFDTELNFTTEDMKEAHQLLTDLSKDDRNLHKFSLPDLSILPSQDIVFGAFASHRELTTKSKVSNEAIIGAFSSKDEFDEVSEALMSLGFKKSDISILAKSMPKDLKSNEDKVKWFLKNSSK